MTSTFLSDTARQFSVWLKGHPIQGYDPSVWRRDDLGNAIRFGDYGDRNSIYGWEIDHHPVPKCFGGTDDLSNLRPLQHKANASHGGMLGTMLLSMKP